MIMFVFWGDGSQESKDLVDAILVRSTGNFNWTFIFILSVVFYVYWSEVQKKDYKAIVAGFSLYGVHWIYEIANAIIGHVAGYPLWSVSNASTTFIWVYRWWGVLPVFITTYIPFFLASNYVPYLEKKKQMTFLCVVWGLVALCLLTLIPMGII